MNIGRIERTAEPRRQRPRRPRRGVAAVEVAITLPLLILLIFGSIEVANGVFLNQALSIAAYEGAREATRPGGTSAVAQQRVIQVLTSRGIGDYVIGFEPEVTEETQRGIAIIVRVQAPMDSFVGPSLGILRDRTSTQQVCMIKH